MSTKSQRPRRLVIAAVIAAVVPAAANGGAWRSLGPAGASIISIAVDRTGALLIADDVGDTVWRVSSALNSTASRSGS